MAQPFTAAKFMTLGFKIRGCHRWSRLAEGSQQAKFRSIFGWSENVVAFVWEMLRTSENADIVIDEHCKPIHLLLTFRWWKSCESMEELGTDFNLCENTVSKWIEVITAKVAACRVSVVSQFDGFPSFPVVVCLVNQSIVPTRFTGLTTFAKFLSHFMLWPSWIQIGMMMLMESTWPTQWMVRIVQWRSRALSQPAVQATNSEERRLLAANCVFPPTETKSLG
jgi:hypothetical protein